MKITDQFCMWIEDFIEESYKDLSVQYEISMIALPGQDGRPNPGLLVVVTIPSGVDLEARIAGTNIIPSIAFRQEQLIDFFRQQIEALQRGRTQALGTADSQPPKPSGLIIPGR